MVALGLLIAVFGVGSVLATAVDVAEDGVAWADTNGEDITYIKTSAVAVFFITDTGLETTNTGTATWEDDNQAVTAGQVFTIPTGYLNATSSTGTYTLTAASYSTTTPADTPLTGIPTVTSGGTGQIVSSATDSAGTFAVLANVAINTTTTATFSHHVRDSYSGGSSTTRRAKVTSTSDPTGEYVDILEVAGVGNVASGNLRQVAAEAGTSSSDGLTLTTTYAPIVDADGDGDVDGADVTITIGTAATAIASSTISSINPSTGVITFTTAQTVSTTTAVSYSHSVPSPTSDFYRGDIPLTSDAAYQGAGDGRVWVQDGDIVTVTYLTSAGVAVSTDTITVDGVQPSITAISPADGSSTNIVNPTIQFDVTDAGSGIPTTAPGTYVTITVNGTVASNPSFQSITDGFRAIYASGTSWLTSFSVSDSTAFQWKIVATDTAGNTKTLETTSLDLTIDTTKPTVSSASTGTAWDSTLAAESATKVNTAVKLTMSEIMDSTTVAAADFTVGGIAPTAAVVGTATGYKNIVYLTTAAQLPDAKPEVKVVDAVNDLAGNAVDTTATLTTFYTTATDGLKAALTVTVGTALGVAADAIVVTVDTDEKLATEGLTISVVGPSASGGNGTLTVSSSAPKNYSGTLTVATAETTGKYGVSIQATDLGSNETDNLTTVTTETVATASVVPGTASTVVTVANGPIGDADFNGVVDADDITSLAFSTNTATASAITAVDASARTITVNVAVGATETATVSYKYTANVFEIDHSAPTASYSPADDTEIEDASPFVTITFDEDEYPGDAFKTVTLTKAEVLNPDGTTTDLLTTLVTKDDIEFIWQASGLALGKYTLTVSATDTAGNTLTDSTSDFTVVEKAKYSVSLRPGWNLVSLPGAPADTAINTVITIAAVDTVLTYDPTLPGAWLTAVRDADGNLAGTLTTVEDGKGYWVHTTTFEAITVDIPGHTVGAAAILPEYTLLAGWNLVSINTEVGATTRDADEYFKGLSWSRIYGYSNSGGTFTSIIPDAVAGTDSNDDLTVGQGYWIYLLEGGSFAP